MRQIALENGRGFALVDDADYLDLGGQRWYLHPAGYAVRFEQCGRSRRSIYMHRQILAAQQGQEVDHANRDKLDNQRANLRFCRHAQNMANTITSRMYGYRGVTWDKRAAKWGAGISVDNRRKNLGRFASAVDAARAYDAAARANQGEYAILNFPTEEAP